MRACIFVDGENFRFSICNLFSDFRREDYLPRAADWTGLFDWIVSQATRDGERVRTYWYVIESVDFYPYKFPDPMSEHDRLQRLLSQHTDYRDELTSLDWDGRTRRMAEIVEELHRRQARMANRFAGWRNIQDGIATRHDAVEFRRAGAIAYNLFRGSLGQEKAVDVKLASDLIILRDIYDVAIILSGDQDYVPAVQIVKDSGKHVVNVSFRTLSGQLLPGGARRLNQVTDRSIEITHPDLAGYLRL